MKNLSSLLTGLLLTLAAHTASALEIDTMLSQYIIDVNHLEGEYFATIGADSEDGSYHVVLFFHNTSATIPADALYEDTYGTVYSHYSAERFADLKDLFTKSATLRMVYSGGGYSGLILQATGKIGASATTVKSNKPEKTSP